MPVLARLLLVDDDESNRDLLCRRLFRSGYHADAAEDGEQALRMVKSRPYDLVLLDHMLPGIGGLEVLRRIRETWSESELPVIMVTALDDSEEIVAALRMGANDYVTKPMDFPVTLARIETRLRLARTDRELRRTRELYRLALGASEDGLWEWDLASGKSRLLSALEIHAGLLRGAVSPARKSGSPACIRTTGRGCGRKFRRISRAAPPRSRASTACSRPTANTAGSRAAAASRATPRAGPSAWPAATPILPCARPSIRSPRFPTGHGWRTNWDPSRPRGGGSPWCFSSWTDSTASKRIFRMESRPISWRPSAGVFAIRSMRAPEGWPAVVARAGERQFGVPLRDASGPAAARQLAACLQAALADAFEIDGQSIFATACAGIAMAYAAVPADDLLRDATAALRHAREHGIGHCEVFQPFMRRDDLAEMHLEHDLHHALERSEFEVWYQPKVDLFEDRIVGCEALVRWRRPGYGLVSPTAFIPAAERNGVIGPLGRFVLQRACRDIVGLRRAYPWLGVSVNVSGRQFAEPDLVEHVHACLDGAGLDHGALQLEITETFLVEDPDRAFATLSSRPRAGRGSQAG